MKRTVLITCLAAALPGHTGAAPSFAEDEFDARLNSVAGTVEVQSAGETDSWRAAEEGMPLEAGDGVRTAADSSAEITLDDGGVIRLGADSRMDISSLSPDSSSFSLRLGALVSKIRSGFIKKGKRLEVRTPAAVCAIRGTEFGVEHDEGSGETTAGVFDEGSLSVSSTGGDGGVLAEEMVGKGNEVRLRAGAKAFKAGAMRRLLRQKKTLVTVRNRLGVLRKNWKRLDPSKKLELRKRFMLRKAVRNARDKKKGTARQNQKTVGLKPGGEPGRPALSDKMKNAIKRADDRTGNKQKRKILGE